MEKVIYNLTEDYANFSDRASRSEYWFFQLYLFIANILVSCLALAIEPNSVKSGFSVLCVCFSLAMFIPSLAVQVRRLHDVNKSGWFLLIYLIPFIGAIFMLILCCTKGTDGQNKFGSDPLEG